MAARRIFDQALRRLARGTVTIADGGRESIYGSGDPPHARVVVRRPAFYARTVFGGTLGAAESYVDGDWDCAELVDLVRILARDSAAQAALETRRRLFAKLADGLLHRLRRNSRRGSSRNIRAHYDLGNEFFGLFLDARMMYSSAYFENAAQTLDAASTAKLARLCAKLRLGPGDDVLEIGGGWGGFAAYAAEHCGCRVTTASISAAQVGYARALMRERGLQEQVRVLQSDYRDIEGRFDKLVCVEMVEAVGHRYLPGYFAACGRLLKPDGLFTLQAITIPEQRHRQALHSVDFIQKHIFPGGCIPSISSLLGAAARRSDLVLADLEDIGAHYARTLAAWRQRFEARRRQALELGFDDRFLRLWRFYFAYCEGGFRERAISDVQMLFAMPGYRGPTRPEHDAPCA